VTLDAVKELAARSVLQRVTVTGVQKKLSLTIDKKGKDARFTIVGMWGHFILKPPVEEYPHLPENEDTVMRLADLLRIPTVPHAVVRLASGERAFISRRVDRTRDGEKLAMEDFCQISGRLTEDKYRGSAERVGKLLRRHSVYPGLDAVDLFERVLFCYITGNADMHLKNYSLVETPQGLRLAPAYDLVSTVLAIPDDPEESALAINGRKSRLRRADFDSLAKALDIPGPTVSKVYRRFVGQGDNLVLSVRANLLPLGMQDSLCRLIAERLRVLAA
jgi:serine/threonine-protein kinase HipA